MSQHNHLPAISFHVTSNSTQSKTSKSHSLIPDTSTPSKTPKLHHLPIITLPPSLHHLPFILPLPLLLPLTRLQPPKSPQRTFSREPIQHGAHICRRNLLIHIRNPQQLRRARRSRHEHQAHGRELARGHQLRERPSQTTSASGALQRPVRTTDSLWRRRR